MSNSSSKTVVTPLKDELESVADQLSLMPDGYIGRGASVMGVRYLEGLLRRAADKAQPSETSGCIMPHVRVAHVDDGKISAAEVMEAVNRLSAACKHEHTVAVGVNWNCVDCGCIWPRDAENAPSCQCPEGYCADEQGMGGAFAKKANCRNHLARVVQNGESSL